MENYADTDEQDVISKDKSDEAVNVLHSDEESAEDKKVY